jgi:ATP-binding cassette subfamily B protein
VSRPEQSTRWVRQRWTAYRAEAIEPRIFVIRQLPVAGGWLLAALTLVNVSLGVLPIVFVFATSVLIGRIPAAVGHGPGSAQWDALVVAFGVASATFLARQVLAALGTFLGSVMKHRVDGWFRDRLIAVSLRSTGIGVLENQEALQSLRQAAEGLETNFRSPGDAAIGTLAYLARYTELIGYLGIVGTIASWPAAVAIAASTMCFRYGHRAGLRVWARLWPVLGPLRSQRTYFRELGLRAAAAKELRVFGLAGWVVDRYREYALASLVPMWAERRRTNSFRFLWFTAVGLLVTGTVLALLVRSAAAGDLTLAHLVLAMQAAIAATVLGDYYHEADDRSQFGMLAARALDDFDKQVAAYAGKDIDTAATGDAAGLPVHQIRFADVSFTYDGGHRPVLDGFELTLRAGECTAIVGLNGAGKTTLVKLLARLYEPSTGAILVDGIDLRQFAVDSWRRQIGVIFQDFNRYELSAADNIAFGAIERPLDEAAVRSAARQAGIAEALDGLPRGMHTLLARQYDDGAELSGGQWQRVAIARALYAVDAGARVLVLDEPTAALDVRAEAAFFDRFVELTRGVTTLLISHRFSSVRHADRIVVLEHGRVVEDGTHDALLAAGGRYAGLFHLQAERFRAGLGADGEPTEVPA